MANVKVWNGQKPSPTYYADLIYPKKAESGTVRLVMRNQQGVIVESLLDLVPEKGVVMLGVSTEFGEQFLCEGGRLKVVEGEIVEKVSVGSGISKKKVDNDEADSETDDMNEGIDVV